VAGCRAAAPARAQPRVVAECVLGQVGQLRERFDPGVAGADEDERQSPRPLLLGERGVGRLELVEDVVAEVDRVGKRLEGERVLGEARDGQRARHGAERQNEVAPLDRLLPLVRLDGGGARVEIEGGHAAEDQLRVRAHLPQRHDAVARLEHSRRRFRQQRGVEHEVLLAHDRRAAVAELARDVRAGEAAADHEDATARLSR
jgi:hypothetical protein